MLNKQNESIEELRTSSLKVLAELQQKIFLTKKEDISLSCSVTEKINHVKELEDKKESLINFHSSFIANAENEKKILLAHNEEVLSTISKNQKINDGLLENQEKIKKSIEILEKEISELKEKSQKEIEEVNNQKHAQEVSIMENCKTINEQLVNINSFDCAIKEKNEEFNNIIKNIKNKNEELSLKITN